MVAVRVVAHPGLGGEQGREVGEGVGQQDVEGGAAGALAQQQSHALESLPSLGRRQLTQWTEAGRAGGLGHGAVPGLGDAGT